MHFGHIRGRNTNRSDVNLVVFEKGKANSEVFMVHAVHGSILRIVLASAYKEVTYIRSKTSL